MPCQGARLAHSKNRKPRCDGYAAAQTFDENDIPEMDRNLVVRPAQYYLLLGVDKRFRDRGLDGLLVYETITRGIKAGYNVSECSWVLEDNMKMRRPLEKIGGRITQTYRVYEKRL